MGRAREIADLIGGTTPDIILKTSDGAILNLQTSDTTVTADSVLGAINFQAPDEASGTDSILIGSKIEAIAEGTFAADNNATKLVFSTGASEAAASKMTLSSGGVLDVDGGITVDNITIDGTEIDLSSGDLTFDVASDIVLDADGGNWRFKDDGTAVLTISRDSNTSVNITSAISDADIIFKGNDGGSTIEIARFDVSAGGFVGIGTTAPAAKLHVESASGSITPSVHADELLVEGSANSGITIGSGTSGLGSLRFADSGGDSQGNIAYDHSDNSLKIFTADSEAIRIISDGKVGIGGFNPAANLHVGGTGTPEIRLQDTDTSGGSLKLTHNAGTSNISADPDNSSGSPTLTFSTVNSERMRIDSSGRLLLGTTSSFADGNSEDLQISSSGDTGIMIKSGTSNFGSIHFGDATSGSARNRGVVRYNHTDDALELFTAESQRVTIDSSGHFSIATTSNGGGSLLTLSTGSFTHGIKQFCNNGQTSYHVEVGGSTVGSITHTTSSTAYNTSSDYRLKENVVTDWDATARLKQLKPSRFNFKTDKATTMDGFLAHEVSSIVPEAISGEKDAVDADGNIEPQGIDQSKLVPLMVKTIQELEARIATLESK